MKQKLENGIALLPSEDMAVIHSINQSYFDEFGSSKPDPKSSQMMSDLLKRKFPSTTRLKKSGWKFRSLEGDF